MPQIFSGSQQLFAELQNCCKHHQDVMFYGSFKLPDDPLVSDKERAQMMAHEIWKVTGYRFR
jgi:hypothetical protein